MGTFKDIARPQTRKKVEYERWTADGVGQVEGKAGVRAHLSEDYFANVLAPIEALARIGGTATLSISSNYRVDMFFDPFLLVIFSVP